MYRRLSIALAVAAAFSLCAVAPLHAQTDKAEFNLAAQGLGAALDALAAKTGARLLYSPEAVKGKQAPALSGNLSLDDALTRLLAGSGLTWTRSADGAYAIKAVPVEMATPLSPIEIHSAADKSTAYHRPTSSIATKTDTPIVQTATKIEVLTQQAIKDMGLQSQGFGQAMAALGIAGKGMGDLGDVYFFRGFETTTTLWNGFRIEDMGSNASNGVNGGVWMNNVERLELLRGTSSILYGRAEPGGAINITTKKPLDEFTGSVDIGIGSHRNRWVSADLTGPLNADKTLLYRLNAGYERSDSWYTYAPVYRSTGVAPALDYRLSPQTRLYFEGQFRNVESGSDQPYMPVVPGTNTMMDVDPKNALMPGTYSKFKQRRAMLGVDHRFNDDWSLTWKYMYNKADNPLTIVSWVVGMYYPPDTPSGDVEFARGLTLNASGQKAHASLLELTGKIETGPVKHKLLFGVDYYDTKSYQHAGFDCWCNNFSYYNPPPYSYNPADFLNAGLLSQYWNLDTNELGVYAQDQLQLPNDFHLLLGGRYQRLKERSVVNYPASPDFNEYIPYKRNIFLPRVSLLWQPVSAISLYYSYSENAGASQGLDFNGKPLKPEFSRQHELGAKFNLVGGRLIASTAVFELTKENIAAADTAHPGFNLEVGRVKSTGYELSLQGAITDNWNVLSTYNYARPYVEVGTSQNGGASSLQPLYISTGTLLPYFSRHSFSFLTSYRLPFAGLQGWKVGGGYNWFSAPTMDENSSVRTHAYKVASAFASYETKLGGYKTTFQLNVDNLFNEKYLLFQGDFGIPFAADPTLGFGYTGGNYVGGNWGQPRTVKLGMRVAF